MRPDLMHEFDLFNSRTPKLLVEWFLSYGLHEVPKKVDSTILKDMVSRPNRSGIDLIGPLNDFSGVGESSRILSSVLDSANILGELANINLSTSPTSSSPRFPALLGQNNSIVVFNGNSMRAVSHRLTKNWSNGRKVLGFWAWELEDLHPSWVDGFNYVDEIITPSVFCANAFSKYTNKKIHIINLPSSYEIDVLYGEGKRTDNIFSNTLSQVIADRNYFLLNFDYLSCPDRKNVLNTLDYFHQAFPSDSFSAPYLVVKAINGDKHELSTLIEEKIRLTPNMIYIDEVLDKYNMKLLIENSLGVISLHRSEGYGLGLLNAMYLGKFVIATNYSGNLEFMTSDNSELIDFSMISTGNLASQIYRETQSRWANPNLDDFIDKIRNCYFNENYRRKKGESAKLSVSHKINSSKVASQFRGLLV